MSSQDIDQAKNKAEFDRLMTAATVFRRRGDYVQATQTIKQALQLCPDDIAAREFAADMIYAHGDVTKAAEHYKAILDIEPGRATAEEKYAKAVLEIAEGDRQRDLVKLMIENPGKFQPVQPKNPTIAVILSAAPGLGHLYCGEYVRGIAIFVGWLLACLLFMNALDPSAGVVQRVTTASAVFACIAVSIHIYALLNSAQVAEKSKAGAHKDPSEPQ